MNVQDDPGSWALQKFGVGQPVPRTEDPKLVRGQGRYSDELTLPDQAYAVIVRSSHAHGVIKGIDAAAALAMPGVLAVHTGADLQAAGYGGLKCMPPLKNRDGTAMKKPPRPALAVDKVRFVGDPVACVIAGTAIEAKEAAEAVVLDIERTPLIEVSTQCVFTNTSMVSAYRGAGRPEGNYFMERLIDNAAREMGIDRLELRRRNQLKPKELPFAAASDQTYDSGDFPAVFKHALELSDWNGFSKRKRESRRRGKLRGIAVGSYLEVTAPPNKEMGGIRFEADRTVTFITGTLDYGQGHATPFAQILSSRLGIPFDRIRLLQGDSDELIAGGGTGGSRSAAASSMAMVEAVAKVVEQGKQAASHFLEAGVADIEFAAGRFTIAGTDRSIGVLELAQMLRSKPKLPEGLPTSLDVKLASEPVPSAFPNGCHVAEVEIDPETGVIAVVKYSSANDFGTVINPLLVEGQMHGGLVQGIGQALMENTVYDEDGQPITGSYMDYAMPRASDVPSFVTAHHPVPAKTNPLGVKGCGEAGCAGALVSVMNAVVDALSEYGVRHIDMPATPERVWQAIKRAQAAPAA